MLLLVQHFIRNTMENCLTKKVNIMENIRSCKYSTDGSYNYEAAIDALNMLQSNADYLRNAKPKQGFSSLESTKRFLQKAEIDVSRMKSVIHVTGTKGKGSTCALCEHILRYHGYKTGFYSSPHLVNVTERIRINGKAISNGKFSENFWQIYEKLDSSSTQNWPIYFQMLTMIAFKVFIEDKVDVAIIEVGIGGEYDSTNVIENTEIVGITSLGLDHTAILGDSLESIAWHKAGIMKPTCSAFTVPQTDSVIEIFRQRSKERKCPLKVVNSKTIADFIGEPSNNEIFNLNYALALKLSESWMQIRGNPINKEKLQLAIENYHWPGRFHIIKDLYNQNFYLDGAHTMESVQYCSKWFLENTINSKLPKVLIFNSTGGRNSRKLMEILAKCNFTRVYFVPNVAFNDFTFKDNTNHNCPASEQMSMCIENRDDWLQLMAGHGNNEKNAQKQTFVFPCVQDAVLNLFKYGKHDVLVTGSLHLIGSALNVLNERNNSLYDRKLFDFV